MRLSFRFRVSIMTSISCFCFYAVADAQVTSIQIGGDFDSGNLSSLSEIVPGEYVFEWDPYNYWGFWFHFRVINGRDSTITFHVQDSSLLSNFANWDVLSPAISPDMEDWYQITDHSYDNLTYSFTYNIPWDTAYICTHPAFNTLSMEYYLNEIEQHPKVVNRDTITHSVQGRPIEMIVLTDPNYPDDSKLGAWMISRQHASELPGWFVLQGLMNWLLSDDPIAAVVMQYMIFNIIPMMNPDGVYLGRYRCNSLDIDLNRQWGNADPNSVPSVYAVIQKIEDWVNNGNDFSLFLDFHSTRNGRSCFNYKFDSSLIPDFISQTYYDNQTAFLYQINDYCPMIDDNVDYASFTGTGTASAFLFMTSYYQYQNPKFFNATYEGINVPVNYGIYSEQPMTIELERATGAGFGEAIYHHYVEPIMYVETTNILPFSYILYQNYPNPFNPITTIQYELPQRSDVQITIYDLLGRKVTTLVTEIQDAGYKSLQWDATNDKGQPVSAGVYFYRIHIGEFVQTRKLVLLR